MWQGSRLQTQREDTVMLCVLTKCDNENKISAFPDWRLVTKCVVRVTNQRQDHKKPNKNDPVSKIKRVLSFWYELLLTGGKYTSDKQESFSENLSSVMFVRLHELTSISEI